ncbi:MAG: hypothetical protein IKN79_08690 [Eubacterium sp.]|nr:hypothetical protein [Eubacterium sp.]
MVSLIEFSVVMDGVGMAMQPLMGTYFGEKNHSLIKRVMKAGIKAALIEGVIATILIWVFSKQFCGLFGITGGASLEPSITAILIELSLFYEEDSVLIVERDSGQLFDLTDSDNQVKGLSSFVSSGLMKAHDEKKYLVTTGYNRNMIRFARNQNGLVQA